MAKAALVIAAGAAPVVGAGGTANAADSLSQATDLTSGLTGLTALDGDEADQALDGTVRTANGVVEDLAGDAVKTAMPILGPVIHDTVHDGALTTANLLSGVNRHMPDAIMTAERLTEALPTLDDPDLNGITIP
jgi:hypothetical protein